MILSSKLRQFFLITILLVSLNVVAYSNENRINDIEVQGTQRIDIDTVLSYADVNIGDIYTEDLGNKILKDLFNTNLFSNIEKSNSTDENTLSDG